MLFVVMLPLDLPISSSVSWTFFLIYPLCLLYGSYWDEEDLPISILFLSASIAVAFDVVHADHIVLFLLSAIVLIPLAKLIDDSTEHLSTY